MPQSVLMFSTLEQLWIRRLKPEILYAVRFFSVEPQFSKPQFKRGRRAVALQTTQVVNGDLQRVEQVRAINEPFISKEDYLGRHQHTKAGLEGVKKFLFC